MLLAEFPLSQDLSVLDAKLTRHNIAHRFTEEGMVQRLWLLHEEDAELAVAVIEGRASDIEEEPAPRVHHFQWPGHDIVPRMAPVTLLFIGLGILGFAFVQLKIYKLVEALAFLPPEVLIHNGHWWRLLTPAFIHFSVLHIIFNGLWIWEVGKRLEVFMGLKHYVGVFVVSGLAGNLAQFYAAQGVLFGGLSGVVYGYFGCIFLLHKQWPQRRLYMPPGMFIMMLVLLLLGFLGIIERIFGMGIANWAHLGGLLGGLAYGLFFIALCGPEKKK